MASPGAKVTAPRQQPAARQEAYAVLLLTGRQTGRVKDDSVPRWPPGALAVSGSPGDVSKVATGLLFNQDSPSKTQLLPSELVLTSRSLYSERRGEEGGEGRGRGETRPGDSGNRDRQRQKRQSDRQ